jgi:hypothetical protein
LAGRDPYVNGMALIRLLSASVELAAAVAMLRLGRVEAALRLNALLGLVGPTILIATTAVGVAGMAGRIAPAKVVLVFMGVYLILFGTR